jgi:hypothetical protein
MTLSALGGTNTMAAEVRAVSRGYFRRREEAVVVVCRARDDDAWSQLRLLDDCLNALDEAHDRDEMNVSDALSARWRSVVPVCSPACGLRKGSRSCSTTRGRTSQPAGGLDTAWTSDDGLARRSHALISLLLVPLAPAIEPFCDLAPLRHQWTQSPCAALRKFVVAPLSKGDAEVRGSLRSIR